MIPVGKYVDVNHPTMKGKSDFEIWEILNFDAKMIVVTEYMGDRLEDAIDRLASKIVEGLRDGRGSGKVERTESGQGVAEGSGKATPSTQEAGTTATPIGMLPKH